MENVRIIVTDECNKKKILRKNSREKKLCNIKFYSFLELKKKVFFDYDNQAIEYIMKNYQVRFEVAKVYLDNMYYLRDLKEDKVQFLRKMKEQLDCLIRDDLFLPFLKDKKIEVLVHNELSKEQRLILNQLNKPFEIKRELKKEYLPKVYEAKTMEEEVLFVVNQISILLDKKIDISKIKIIINDDYQNVIKRYFSLFHIPINLKSNHSFYSTFISQEFLKNYYSMEIEENIEVLKEKYEDINDFITILNKSVLVKDKELRKEFIIQDLKNSKIKNEVYDKAIEVCTLEEDFEEDVYVFLLGFNINCYPLIYKDDDYFSDEIKSKLDIDTSIDKNRLEKNKVIYQIKGIKNLTITYKLSNGKSVFYPSLLIQDLDLDVLSIYMNEKVSYSKINSQLQYARALDNLYKFNMISEELGLYRSNLVIPYLEYDNRFKKVNLTTLKERIGLELMLAYTNMQMYNECAFKYYLSKILKIDIYEESFKTIIGNIVHHILEIGIVNDIQVLLEISKYVKEKEYLLGSREIFYLEKLSKELEEVIKVMKEQEKHSKLNNYLFENEIHVYYDKEDVHVTFKGLIDKVMYQEKDGKEILAVVDYKTGNPIITLDNLKYGLNMQLPIYLYLLKKSERFKKAKIAGFYIQKVLENVPNIEENKTLSDNRKASLRLQGFTNSDSQIIEMLDDEYLENKVLKNLKYKKDGNLDSRSKVLSNKEMDELTQEVEAKIEECIDNILEGNFDINPKVIKGHNIACEYCKFKDICFVNKKNEVILGGEESEMDGRTSFGN